MLWTCLHFPALPLHVFARSQARARPAVVSSTTHRPDVIAANDAARKRGIVAGLSIASALALDPDLTIHLRDERAEAAALRNIALWAGQWTSTISIEMPADVLLEISGCLNYFGGLDQLLDRIDAGLAAIGYSGVVATAPTAIAASLFAHAGQAVAIEQTDELENRFAALPVDLLWTYIIADSRPPPLSPMAIGVRTIGDLLALPRDGIARRFGQDLLDTIGRAKGELPDPRPLFIAPERYHGQLELPTPVSETEALLFATKRLVAELVGFLRGRGAGVTRLRCDLIHEDESPTAIVVGLTATRQIEHIVNVLRERLAHEPLPDRVEAIRLVSEEIVPLAAKDGELFAGGDRNTEAYAQLVERLRARLGDAAVRVIALHADHRPERAWQQSSIAVDAPTTKICSEQTTMRPLWLLPEPRPLKTDPASVQMKLLSGPERIETGWWDGNEIGRDYFVGRDAQGGQCWLYRDRSGHWFVHGLFA